MSKDKDIFAFPNTSDYTHKNGMTLRDYFAAMAMQPMFEVWEDFEDWGFEELAMRSYEMADAMLKEREK